MKYQHITEDEIKTIREAKKVMKKIAKRFSKFEAKEVKVPFDENDDWELNKQFCRFHDEIDSIFEYDGSKFSINVDVDVDTPQTSTEDDNEFIVTFKVDSRLPIKVRAKNIEEAKEKAQQEFGEADLSNADFVDCDIVSIKDKDGNLTDLI
jgi:hypothetical protein